MRRLLDRFLVIFRKGVGGYHRYRHLRRNPLPALACHRRRRVLQPHSHTRRPSGNRSVASGPTRAPRCCDLAPTPESTAVRVWSSVIRALPEAEPRGRHRRSRLYAAKICSCRTSEWRQQIRGWGSSCHAIAFSRPGRTLDPRGIILI